MQVTHNKGILWVAWLAVLTVFYVVLLWIGILRERHHTYLVLLAIQYVLILPSIVVYLRSQANSQFPAPSRLLKTAWVVLAFAALAIPLSWFSTQGLLNPDESGYSFQARIFLSGHLKAAPLVGASDNVLDTPRELYFENHILRPDGWFPKFPPGWPLVLTCGYALSVPWLVAPLLGIGSLVIMAAIGSRLFSREAAALAVLFAALSSFYLVNSIGLMSHALCGFLSVLACLWLFQGVATRRMLPFVGMFACLSMAFQVRPYTAFALALVMTIAAFWGTRTDRRLWSRLLGIGILFGALALAGILVGNYLYTGKWLVSPYALAAGANAPPELSLNPVAILRGVAAHGRETFEESLIGLFPFLYLLAIYALFKEEMRREEVRILAIIYLGLVIAYLAHPGEFGGFFGERFHFEVIYAVFLLAARGATLWVERLKIAQRAVAYVLGLFTFLQVNQQAVTTLTISRLVEPYRMVRDAAFKSTMGAVFLHDSPGFVAKHFNINEADWAHAPRVFLIDAEPERRNDWACRFHASTWTSVGYDPVSRAAVSTSAPTHCLGVNENHPDPE